MWNDIERVSKIFNEDNFALAAYKFENVWNSLLFE